MSKIEELEAQYPGSVKFGEQAYEMTDEEVAALSLVWGKMQVINLDDPVQQELKQECRLLLKAVCRRVGHDESDWDRITDIGARDHSVFIFTDILRDYQNQDIAM